MIKRHFHFFACIALSFALTLLCSSDAHGQRRPGFATLDHVIDETVFEALCDHLRLSDEQRHAARFIFEPYFEAVTELEAETAERLDEHYQWIRKIQKNVDPQSEQADENSALFSNRAGATISQALRRADDLFATFFVGLNRMLADEQRERLMQGRRLVRRMNEFPGQIHGPIEGPPGILERVPDLLSIIASASQPDAELAFLLDQAIGQPDGDLHGIRETIKKALLDYEVHLDHILEKEAARRRIPQHWSPDQMRRSWDDPRDRAVLKERARQWCERYNTVQRPFQQINLALRAQGFDDIADSLELRYWREWVRQYDTHMFIELPLDQLPRWVSVQKDFSEEEREVIMADYEKYIDRRHQMHREIFRVAMNAMCERGLLLGDVPPVLEYARKVLALVAMHEDTVARLQMQIPAGCREDFNRHFNSDPYASIQSKLLVLTRDMVSPLLTSE